MKINHELPWEKRTSKRYEQQLNKIEGWCRDGRTKKYTNKICRDNLSHPLYIPMLAFWVAMGRMQELTRALESTYPVHLQDPSIVMWAFWRVDLYLDIVLCCAHVQIRKHMAFCAVVIGVVNKTRCLLRSWGLPKDLRHNEASFSTISTDMSWLWVPRCPDLAIFRLTDDDRQTQLITSSLAHVCGITNQ